MQREYTFCLQAVGLNLNVCDSVKFQCVTAFGANDEYHTIGGCF